MGGESQALVVGEEGGAGGCTRVHDEKFLCDSSLCSAVLEPFMICKASYSFRKHFCKAPSFSQRTAQGQEIPLLFIPPELYVSLFAFCRPSLGWSEIHLVKHTVHLSV